MPVKKKITTKELQKKMEGFSRDFFLVNVREYRNEFLSLSYEEIIESQDWQCFTGKVLNYIMDGNLKEAWNGINSIPEEKSKYLKLLKIGLTIVHPEITWKQFSTIINYLKSINQPLYYVIFTAGRPFLLNGLNDFSRIGSLLPKYRERFIDYLQYLYHNSLCPYIYNLCLAEYYYQIDRLVDAEMIVSSTIKRFDVEGEQRILFTALYLQSKILLANGNTVNSESFISNIRNLTGETGTAEFSYNIDAAETLFALYEGKTAFVNDWLMNHAPDEFADFNMLDLYRYMIKMRCYIVNEKYTAVIALAERLRPLLIEGRRFMDLCELDLLVSISLYDSGKEEEAFEALRRSLKIARLHRYYRLIADEGEPILRVLIAYTKHRGENPFLLQLVKTTRSMAIKHPLYLKKGCKAQESLTPMELDILSLLQQGKTKEEIADYFFISINTVKFHIKNIYTKLNASSATQAIWNARMLGVIN